MATILLQAAGAALGSVFGVVGKAVGLAAGSLAGYLVDRALINSTKTVEGARLNAVQPITGEEGAPVARLYGTMRLGGTVIWATRFEETRQSTRQGLKGGPRVVSYRYHANVAFGLCEGEIAGIRRVWADGRELDLTTVDMRVHTGGEAQLPDPLIEAKQGAGNAPAYRGLAYVVFERLALEPYGNRIPQLQFEVMRPVSALNKQIRAVALIPGATEYGLHPQLVTAEPKEGVTQSLNRHALTGPSDFSASLDELQALCPNFENVALVIAWFGDDLRAGHCSIRPVVTTADLPGVSLPWSACGVTRAEARVVSMVSGRSAYGGTPADATVIAAIRDLKARGLKVTLYPFVMMDIPPGNGLADPYGGVEQPAFPWRGRVTTEIAPGRPGTTDKTAGARVDVDAFCGLALPSHFTASADGVAYGGPAGDFGYRRFVLHCAALASAAGGVDGFLLGSELRGLTTLRDDANAFPFVEALQAMAGDVRSMLGPATAITYGADWSEYFGHQPADGSGDVFFHLDPLWAHPAIDAVGVDNYFPLSDWRDGDWGAGNPDGATGPTDRAAMTAAIGAGEGFDWFYASESDRRDRARTPIADGAHGKPWVYRPKDLVSWWSSLHFNRPGGAEEATPTDWIPGSKPIWFTELGCPAVDKGANQPNVFPDPKSTESALPHFSSGGRDDAAQGAFLAAHMGRWLPGGLGHQTDWNPVSPVYGGPMVAPEKIFLWAWDARPFPAFPAFGDVWGDHANHQTGHWLNGRLCGADLGGAITAILADHGLPAADATCAAGSLSGYVIERPASAREAIEPLIELYGLIAHEADGAMRFRTARSAPIARLGRGELVSAEGEAIVQTARTPDHDLPTETIIAFRNPLRDHQTATARAGEPEGRGGRSEALSLPLALDAAQAEALATDRIRRVWTARDRGSITLPSAARAPTIGEAIRFDDGTLSGDWLTVEADEGSARRLTLVALDRSAPAAANGARATSAAAPPVFGRPLAEMLDLPFGQSETLRENRLLLAAWASPWRPQSALAGPGLSAIEERGRAESPATIGELETPLAALDAGASGRVLDAGFDVRLSAGALASVDLGRLLNGANIAAVRAASGQWEVLQFLEVAEFAPNRWRLRGFLRGQAGTEDAMASGAPAGARFVVLDDAVVPAGLRNAEIGLLLDWRIGPSGAIDQARFASKSVAGGVRAGLHLSPAHLRAEKRSDGSIRLSWIRRGRFRADSWDGEDIALDAGIERYRLAISVGGSVISAAETAAAEWIWPEADVVSAFGATPAAFTVEVRQLSPENGAGLPATRHYSF